MDMGWFSDHFMAKQSQAVKDEPTWCVPSALMSAWIWQAKRGQETRIAVSHTDKEGVNHFQAQYKGDDNDWHFLTEIYNGKSMAVIPYGKNYPEAKEPHQYMTLEDAFKEQLPLIQVQPKAQ